MGPNPTGRPGGFGLGLWQMSSAATAGVEEELVKMTTKARANAAIRVAGLRIVDPVGLHTPASTAVLDCGVA